MQTQGNNPIVITGCGWVTPFAAGGIETVLQTAAGQAPDSNNSQGYRPIADDLLAGFPVLSPECRNDPGAWLAAVALNAPSATRRLSLARSHRSGSGWSWVTPSPGNPA